MSKVVTAKMSLPPKRVKLKKDKSLTLNIEDFTHLTDILFESLKCNNARCARALGISTQTWMKWNRTPPKWIHWNTILYLSIVETISSISNTRGYTKIHKDRIINAIGRYREYSKLSQSISEEMFQTTDAAVHLRTLLRAKGMFWDQIRLPRNSGGFSEHTLRRAAKSLNVTQDPQGYGEDKRSFWYFKE